MKKKIAVIGYGYVGKAVTNLFKSHYEVRIKDLNKRCIILNGDVLKIQKFYADKSMWKWINECDLGIVCVPTPMKEDGNCDTSIVEEVIRELETPIILIKSTVPPGTTERLKKETGKRICFSPEFAGESKYWSPYDFDTDMKASPQLIVGGDREDTRPIIDIMAVILGPKKFYRQTDSKTAELVKYWENMFFATKVTFVNEMYEICEALGVDYWEARDLWGLDPRVELMHTAVFEDNRGYGGKCFTKDTNALVSAAKKAGYEPRLLEEVISSNERFISKNKL